MRNKLFFLMVLFIIIPSAIWAQVGLKGYILTDTRVFLEDQRFYWNENRLDLQIDASLSESAHIYSELWVRGFGFSDVKTSADLMARQKDKVQPWNMVLREAYLDLYGFLLPDLDIRIGRQRIAWGTADKLNPTDNLNPYDLEDIWDFGRHLGSNAIKASYYLGDYTLTGVYIPVFIPAVLPTQDWAQALSPELALPPGFTQNNLEDQIQTPENTLKNFTAAFKIAKNFFGYDFSMSYLYGWDDLPIVTNVGLTPVNLTGAVDIATTLAYKRMQVFGLDMAGSLGKIGVWAEGAIFFPEKTEMTTDLSAFGYGIQTSLALDDEPYMKYVIGMDYSFKNGIYLNCQYLHGFIHERGRENLEDYFMFGAEKKLLNDKLKITSIAGGLEIKDFSEIKDNYAILYGPEITYYPVDNAEIIIGGHIIEGKSTTVFGRVKKNDEVYVKVRYSF